MEFFAIIVITVSLTFVAQEIVRKIKSFFIIRKMNQAGKALEKRIADELESKKYVKI